MEAKLKKVCDLDVKVSASELGKLQARNEILEGIKSDIEHLQGMVSYLDREYQVFLAEVLKAHGLDSVSKVQLDLETGIITVAGGFPLSEGMSTSSAVGTPVMEE